MLPLFSSVGSVSEAILTFAHMAFISSQGLLQKGVRSNRQSGGSPASCLNSQISCQNHTAVQDTCCFNAPGGLLLQTQFWDYSPVVGPNDSWTIHGLWPDNCDGSYDANCDHSRAYTNISAIIRAAGQTSLLSYMHKYWKPNGGQDEELWYHEWNKHGTCISTLEPKCYTGYRGQEEVVDYFQSAVDLYKSLPSYSWLAEGGVIPSKSRTYTSDEIQHALEAPRGVEVVIRCDHRGALSELWYFHDVKGSVQTGTFVPAQPDGTKSNCPSSGIRYIPKVSSDLPGTTTLTTVPTASQAPPFQGKGTLHVTTGGQKTGCIISRGTWYTSGTCAKFTAKNLELGFTLSSRKGDCAIKDDAFSCGSTITTPTTFAQEGVRLMYRNSSTFYASSVPQGWKQSTISVMELENSLTISWEHS